MIFYIVIGLVIALVVLAIFVNAVQQHKEKVEAEKKQELTKYKKIIEDTEDLLMNAGSIPVSKQLVLVMHQRILDAVKAMAEIMPDAPEMKQRLRDAENRAQSIDNIDKVQSEENFALPEDDKAIIAIIQSIKKLRALLRAEHTKGKVDTHLFMNEDKRLERFQLKINVESLMKRGKGAQTGNMLGSARQYYEKALATIKAQPIKDEYVTQREQELETTLTQIASDLKSANTKDRMRKAAEEQDDLDVLFQPKKKW